MLVLTVLICLKNDRLEIPFVHIAQGETVDSGIVLWDFGLFFGWVAKGGVKERRRTVEVEG